MTENSRLNTQQWTEFWKQSTVTSFQSQSNINYDRNYALFWNRQWSQLIDNASIVDLATGNGAIALLAAKFASENNLNFHITGIDNADISPATQLSNVTDVSDLVKRVNFLSSTPIEDSKLAAQSFDLITSQYGFEYSDLTRSVEESRRIAKPHGRLALILHNEDSLLIKQAKDAHGLFSEIYIKSRLDEKLTELLLELEKREPNTVSHGCEKLRMQLNDTIAHLNTLDKSYTDTFMLDYALPNLMLPFGRLKNLSLDKKIAHITQVKNESELYNLRMKDLISASLSKLKFEELINILNENQFKVESSGEFYYDEKQLMGWQLEAKLSI